MMSLKSFRATSMALAGIEMMHMICKGQMTVTKGEELSFVHQFCALAG